MGAGLWVTELAVRVGSFQQRLDGVGMGMPGGGRVVGDASARPAISVTPPPARNPGIQLTR